MFLIQEINKLRKEINRILSKGIRFSGFKKFVTRSVLQLMQISLNFKFLVAT